MIVKGVPTENQINTTGTTLDNEACAGIERESKKKKLKITLNHREKTKLFTSIFFNIRVRALSYSG